MQVQAVHCKLCGEFVGYALEPQTEMICECCLICITDLQVELGVAKEVTAFQYMVDYRAAVREQYNRLEKFQAGFKKFFGKPSWWHN